MHRELRLKTIYLDTHGQPKLTGFSLSRLITMARVNKANGNELVFYAPEVITSAGFSTASDIWSLGVIAYTLL